MVTYILKNIFKKIKNEEGITLVELLAAITILSIIISAFLAFFSQAANTNKQTNNINEATFVAQEEMERVTYLSTINSLEVGESSKENNGYKVFTKINEDTNLKLYKVIVEVTEGGKLRAKMETRLPFGKTTSN